MPTPGTGWVGPLSTQAERKRARKRFNEYWSCSPITLSQRKYEQAEIYLLKAAPRAPAAWYGLARLYLLQGKFEQAQEFAQKLVDSGQGDSTANKMLQAAQAREL